MCVLCEKVKSPGIQLIEEFEHSILVTGDHQFFSGYCQLIYKEHVADLTDLTQLKQEAFFKELMMSAKAIRKAFNPTRLNYSSLGNVVPHIHFHLFPRYQSELEMKDKLDPWADAHLFEQYLTTAEQAKELKASVRKAL